MPLLQHGDAVILLLELQPEIVMSNKTVPEHVLRRAVRALVTAGRDLDVPAFASVVPLGSATPGLIGEVENLSPVVRTTISAFADARIAEAIECSGRKVLLLGGVSAEIAVLQSAIDACHRGYEVHVLADCCGGLSGRTEATAFRQIEKAGGLISNVSSCLTSLVDDMATPVGHMVMAALAELWSWELPAQSDRCRRQPAPARPTAGVTAARRMGRCRRKHHGLDRERTYVEESLGPF